MRGCRQPGSDPGGMADRVEKRADRSLSIRPGNLNLQIFVLRVTERAEQLPAAFEPEFHRRDLISQRKQIVVRLLKVHCLNRLKPIILVSVLLEQTHRPWRYRDDQKNGPFRLVSILLCPGTAANCAKASFRVRQQRSAIRDLGTWASEALIHLWYVSYPLSDGRHADRKIHSV